MRIPRNINTEVEEEKREIASDIMKTIKYFWCKNKGKPVSWLLPPKTVKTIAKHNGHDENANYSTSCCVLHPFFSLLHQFLVVPSKHLARCFIFRVLIFLVHTWRNAFHLLHSFCQTNNLYIFHFLTNLLKKTKSLYHTLYGT